ncbi:MAG: histidine kinase [Dehalococcoidia bacterium]|nr:histidine kinase [Dehalococcoidia bacterium]
MRSFLKDLSLKRRITLSVALGLASILAVFGYMTMWAVQQSTDEIYREREALVRSTAGYVDGLMRRVQSELQAAAALASQGISLGDRRKVIVALQSDAFSSLMLVGNNGDVIWQDPSDGANTNVSGWPCVETSLRTGKPAATTLLAGPGGDPAACSAFPLSDGSGELVAELNLRSRDFNVLPVNNGEQSVTFELTDESGAILASSDPNSVEVWSEHMSSVAPLIAAHQSGVRVHVMPEGSVQPTHLVAYAPLASVPQWSVMVEQNQDVALALPRSLEWRIMLIGAVMLLLGSVVAWTDVRRVVQPLGMLTRASARMAAGDLESSITTTRGDELGELARTLDLMRGKLKDSLEEIGRWNRELEDRVRQRTQEMAALFEASQTLTLTLGLMRDERQTYAQLTSEIARVAGAEKCLIALLREGGKVAGQAPGFGIEEERIKGFGYSSSVLNAPSIVGSGTNPTGDASHGLRFLEAFGGGTVLAVPLQVEGKGIGIVFAGEKPGGFTEDDARLLTIVAGQAAVVIENARLYGELQRKEEIRRQLLDKVITAQEEERKRISRELHDDIGQALTALVMNLGGIEESLSPELGEVRGRLASIRDLTSETLASTRRLMLDLRPTLLDDLGLIPAISWYAENNLGRAHTNSRVEVSGFQSKRLPVQMETVLFRVIQEAITNIVKHSGATDASIRLELVGRMVTACIADNGRGFEAGDRVSGYNGGLGLLGIQERVSLLGGSLQVESKPGEGTTLRLKIPLGDVT